MPTNKANGVSQTQHQASATIGGFSWDFVSRILFPAPLPSYTVDSFPTELIWVPRKYGPDGAAVCSPDEHVPCLFLPYSSARFLVLFFHSNAEDIGKCYAFCNILREQFQVHVLAVEYPGYGICPGVCDEKSVMENAFAAFKFVIDVLHWPLDGIKIFGRSIGTGPALALAKDASGAKPMHGIGDHTTYHGPSEPVSPRVSSLSCILYRVVFSVVSHRSPCDTGAGVVVEHQPISR